MRIIVRNVQHVFKAKRLFDNLSFEVESGAFCVIYGPSGSGKSTLLNFISGLSKPDKGSITISHENQKLNIMSRDFRKRHLNYVFQNFALLENETVYENLCLPLVGKSLRKKEKEQKIIEVLEYVGLKDTMKQTVSELSGGEQQRISIARVLLKEGNLILADEPTGNLDVANRQIIIELLLDLQKQGKTIIVVSHDAIFREYASQIVEL